MPGLCVASEMLKSHYLKRWAVARLPAPLPAAMRFGVDPLPDPVIAESDVADGGPISLGTFVTLPVL